METLIVLRDALWRVRFCAFAYLVHVVLMKWISRYPARAWGSNRHHPVGAVRILWVRKDFKAYIYRKYDL